LQHIDSIDEYSAAATRSKNISRALRLAEEYDRDLGLSPSNTTVNRRLEFYPAEPDT